MSHSLIDSAVLPRAGDNAFRIGLQLVELHSEEARPRQFEMAGLQWQLLPQVFAPTHTASTVLFTEWLPFPVGGTFLEVGCGAGVTAVVAALQGCSRVTAVDIDPTAVRNTELNAARHGVLDRLRVLRSDLYSAVAADEKFDLVFWNSNVIFAPDDFVYTRGVQRAIFDRSYAAHDRYLREGLGRLTPGGRMFLGFNSLGDAGRLTELVAASGARITERRRATRHAGGAPVTFQLLEVTRSSGSKAA
ncbi:50S ribosomal protein L11 methyltransferase [Streptomyces sp. NPDC087917]|uniref:50S ribosomal protein L11 methyltransferase n=1 Tax=Streptomyces sp. NPDC087917 TaxID=3155060 RepID=UPI003425E74D